MYQSDLHELDDVTSAADDQAATAIATGGDLIGNPDNWFEVRQLRANREEVELQAEQLVDSCVELADEDRREAYAEGHSDGRDDEAYTLGKRADKLFGPLLIAARDLLDALDTGSVDGTSFAGSSFPEAAQLAVALGTVEAAA